MIENNLISIIIFAPLLGAVINWLIGGKLKNEFFSGVVACGSIAVSTLVAFYITLSADGGALFIDKPIFDHLWTWVQVGTFRADFGLAIDHLSAIYVMFVTFVGFLIHVFAVGYMRKDPGFYRFFAYLNLFMFSMLTLILADNFLLMFVGWEGVGLCSYLLIGYYLQSDEARRAAKKAFVANRIGDWGVIMGVFLLFMLTGSISFYDKIVGGEEVRSALNIMAALPQDPFTWGAIFAGGATSVALLLFIGATGKSAQIPLYVWLPDAMAGPTPVSALIHAATMVTAGVYMVVRCNGIFQNAPSAMFTVAIIGAATAIFAATIGLAQNDIKKVLAYSTVSQLGYMFLACGVGAFSAAIFHVMTHAFFKALLFLGSGSVIHGMHHEQDMRRMGNLKKYMPITFATMFTGWLAICGIIPFAGFFSKDEILYRTFDAKGLGNWSMALWIVGITTAVLTAVYMTRLMIMTFWGKERFNDAPVHEAGHHDAAAHDEEEEEGHHHHGPIHPHESPWTMTVPLIVLAFLSTVGGLVGIPYALSSLVGAGDVNVFEHVLEPVIAKRGPAETAESHGSQKQTIPHTTKEVERLSAEKAAEHSTAAEEAHSPADLGWERGLAALSLGLALVGIFIGFSAFKNNPLRKMPKILEEKWRIDEVYNRYIIDPIANFSREGLWKGFDLGFIDGAINAIGALMVELGTLLRGVQVGFVRSYAAMILFGGLLLLGFFVYYGFRLIG
ncbi:MAG TPA: NADH-quinone oxidoreductase subunit L [Pyrinomonadaceae bacterium]|jgi:NADH-quinone oxidoreductase subunit L|nr:NADH-quinone oxidoreductase subunit L [Pyrinomonadaceae bacterium]